MDMNQQDNEKTQLEMASGMSCGLSTAIATSERLKLVYLDDIIIMSEIFQEHPQNLIRRIPKPSEFTPKLRNFLEWPLIAKSWSMEFLI